jgi:hypothetical protein
MTTTHVAAGVLLALPVAAVAPEYGALAGAAAVCGGLFPDLDAFVGVHRKSLHFPVYYPVVALLAAVGALVVPGPATVATAVFFAAAGLHAASDVFGGTADARPWTGSSTRAVYVHALGRWVAPRRFVRYDGAPEDFVVGVALTIPGLLWYDGAVRGLLLVGLILAAVYTAFRRQIPDLLGV